jgi:hypothetical protein
MREIGTNFKSLETGTDLVPILCLSMALVCLSVETDKMKKASQTAGLKGFVCCLL